MLPEHVDALKKLYEAHNYKVKPILDEQQMMENGLTLQSALYENLTVEIKYYLDHDFQTVKGKVLLIEVHKGFLRIENMEVELEDIIEVSIL